MRDCNVNVFLNIYSHDVGILFTKTGSTVSSLLNKMCISMLYVYSNLEL